MKNTQLLRQQLDRGNHAAVEAMFESIEGALKGIIDLARDPAGSGFTLREMLNEQEGKRALEALGEYE
jgi:hypothetical protein